MFSHEFDTELDQLNHQLCKALTDLQSSLELKFVHDLQQAPSFQIHIHSNGELEEPQTSTVCFKSINVLWFFCRNMNGNTRTQSNTQNLQLYTQPVNKYPVL